MRFYLWRRVSGAARSRTSNVQHPTSNIERKQFDVGCSMLAVRCSGVGQMSQTGSISCLWALGLGLALAGLASGGDEPSVKAFPKLTLKTGGDASAPKRLQLFVLEGSGGGPIHRAGPEHFKLTRLSDGQTVSLSVEYDRETLDEQEQRRSEGTPRNPRLRTPALKSQYGYNHQFQRIRLFLDNGRHDAKDAMEERDCLDLYGRATLKAGERYRLTWACWPVGAAKATELSVEFELAKVGAFKE